MNSIDIVQGANWGSEAKGSVMGFLALERDYRYAVRTGAINAGHTVYYQGKPYAMQQLPTAWVNPNCALVIGPGAYVHLPTLQREIDMVELATGKSIKDRLFVDSRVSVHLDSYADESKRADRHRKIGATGKGCAEAIVHKIKDRGDNPYLLLINYMESYIRDDDTPTQLPWTWANVPTMLTRAYDAGAKIALEGTQGELLDLHLGPWPYVTSRQTTAAAWVAEAGLSPALNYSVVLVARTYPIRVAGNSGPMWDEITWPALARSINLRLDRLGVQDHPLRVGEWALAEFEQAARSIGGADLVNHNAHTDAWRVENRIMLSDYAKLAVSAMEVSVVAELMKLFEFTTVTKKLRRVSNPDWIQLGHTMRLLKPSLTVLTFLNYVFPELHGKDEIHDEAVQYIKAHCPGVGLVNLGPLPEHFVWMP